MYNKNILIVIPAGKINGTAKTFLAWIKTLYNYGSRIVLFTEKNKLAEWTENLCEKQYFFKLARLEPSLSRLMKIIKIVKVENIDIIWGVGTTSSMMGSLAGIICKKKYLNILNISRKQIWPVNPHWKYPFNGHIVTVSEHYLELLVNESKIPRHYCHFIPARFDLDELKPIFPNFNKANSKILTVSLFCRFDEKKALNVSSFLMFVKKNKDSLVHCKFNLYGGGDSECQINEKVQKLRNFGVDITNNGFIKDVHKVMVDSDIVIGSERVAIESILSGRPVCIIGDKGIVDFVTGNNIQSFMSDNFTNLANSDQHSLSTEETLVLFNDYEKILSRCNLQYCYKEVANKYGAEKGVKELIRLSEISNSKEERLKRLFRILWAITKMYSTKIQIAFKNLLGSI